MWRAVREGGAFVWPGRFGAFSNKARGQKGFFGRASNGIISERSNYLLERARMSIGLLRQVTVALLCLGMMAGGSWAAPCDGCGGRVDGECDLAGVREVCDCCAVEPSAAGPAEGPVGAEVEGGECPCRATAQHPATGAAERTTLSDGSTLSVGILGAEPVGAVAEWIRFPREVSRAADLLASLSRSTRSPPLA